MNLWRGSGRPLVVGHRGAPTLAPENSLESLAAAVAAGADIVEFDVQPGLQLAHSAADEPAEPVSLDDALDLLGPHGVGIQLDLKLPGYEEAALAAVRRHSLLDRVLVSTTWAATMHAVERLAPEVPRAIGYPRDRYGVSHLPWPPVAGRLGAAAARRAMPIRIDLLFRRTHPTALAVHHMLCTHRVVALAHRRGAPVLAWTANEPAAVVRAAALGVDAIVTDDPGMALATLTTP
jgi:glycerophosphoryl diester phosphodiesterase